jgi:hypothetical protein
MDAEMGFLIANVAGVKGGSSVLDPFCGTSGDSRRFLMACSAARAAWLAVLMKGAVRQMCDGSAVRQTTTRQEGM